MPYRLLSSVLVISILLSALVIGLVAARGGLTEEPAHASSKLSQARAEAVTSGSSGTTGVLLRLDSDVDRAPLRAFVQQLGARVAYEYQLLPDVIAVRGVPTRMLEQIQAHPAVRWMQPDRVRRAALIESVPLINADTTSMAGYADGTGVVVCVLDTGANKTHPALSGAVVAEKDFVNNDSDATDDEGHGTHVAGIVLSRDATYQGVAPGAGLAVGKVLDATGSGYDSDIIAGIDWCTTTAGADVINMSLGGQSWPGSCDFDVLASAVNASVDAGVVNVIASGNEGELHAIGSPGCARRAITVGAVYDDVLGTMDWCTDLGCSQVLCTDSDIQPDDVVCFSNGSPKLTVVAPGSVIESADGFSDGFVTDNSTSMAAPHVSGLVARLLGENPGFTPIDTMRWLARNAVDLESPGFDDRSGNGRIDALATLMDNKPVTCSVPADCSDGDPCTAEACPAGFCAYLPTCDDGDPCTIDECSAGICSHLPVDIDDGVSCTDDSCDSCLGPVHTVAGGNCNVDCATAIPVSVGMSVNGHLDTDTPNTYDSPCSGYGAPGPDLAYRIHLRPEQPVNIKLTPTSSWDPAVYILMRQGTSDCDANRCVGGMDIGLTAETEEMERVRVPEPDDYYIVVDTFDPGHAGSFHLEIQAACDLEEEGRPCDDGNACTLDDTCTAGVCAGMSVPACDDGNPCTLDYFDGVYCQNPVAPPGFVCDDGESCTTGDRCDGLGNCVGVNECVFSCGGAGHVPCPPDAFCLDSTGDGCSAACGGADCGGVCAVLPSVSGLPCGGIAGVPCSAGLTCIDDPRDTCLPGCGGLDCAGVCVVADVACGGPAGSPCPAGFTCADDPVDGCHPACGGLECAGICVPEVGSPCVSGVPCPSGLFCVDDPTDPCQPACGGADCGGLCAAPTGLCGGITGVKCPAGFACVDDPEDGCDPACGGAACGGICVADADAPPVCGGIARIPCAAGLICIDDPTDACDPDCGGADCGGICVSPCGFPKRVLSLQLEDPDRILWESLECVETYSLYRLTAPRLGDADEDGLADDYGVCFAPGLAVPEAFDSTVPPAGWSHFYLATGESSLGEGPLGFNSTSQERPNYTACP